MTRVLGLCALLLVGSSHSALAQSPGVAGYFTYGSTSFAAADSFEATMGTRTDSGFGFGATITNIWKRVFVDIGYAQQELDGNRVFIDNGTVYNLGIPLTVTTRPFDLVGGWRFSAGRVFPYIGAGMSFISYKETAPFAIAGDDIEESSTGAAILGGVDVSLTRLLRVGGEFRYRAVNGALGVGGVSAEFGEDQLGGFAAALRISVGR
jgi:opacity protein-like surface antigen